MITDKQFEVFDRVGKEEDDVAFIVRLAVSGVKGVADEVKNILYSYNETQNDAALLAKILEKNHKRLPAIPLSEFFGEKYK